MMKTRVNGQLVTLSAKDEALVNERIARGEALKRTTSDGDILLDVAEEAALRAEWVANAALDTAKTNRCEALAALENCDRRSVRAMREYLVGNPEATAMLVAIEVEAIAQRKKLGLVVE